MSEAFKLVEMKGSKCVGEVCDDDQDVDDVVVAVVDVNDKPFRFEIVSEVQAGVVKKAGICKCLE
jgi:hypothetical protein